MWDFYRPLVRACLCSRLYTGRGHCVLLCQALEDQLRFLSCVRFCLLYCNRNHNLCTSWILYFLRKRILLAKPAANFGAQSRWNVVSRRHDWCHFGWDCFCQGVRHALYEPSRPCCLRGSCRSIFWSLRQFCQRRALRRANRPALGRRLYWYRRYATPQPAL